MRKRLVVVGLSAGLAAFASTGFSEDELEWDEAELFFELNDTDGDLGIHANIDGGPWKNLAIEDLDERTILKIRTNGRLRRQGMTQMAWESAEPTFDELSPEAFFNRFPEGVYEIEGTNLDNEELEAEVELSHVMAAPAPNLTVNGNASAEDCDAPVLPIVTLPVMVDWGEVTQSHPSIGTPGVEVEIARYQFFVERDDLKISVDLGPDVTEFPIPNAFLEALGPGVWKYEVIARTEGGNNTAIETCFELAL